MKYMSKANNRTIWRWHTELCIFQTV